MIYITSHLSKILKKRVLKDFDNLNTTYMVSFNESENILKAKGSKVLKNHLQNGDIKAIAEHFGCTYTVAYNVICGKHFGEKRIIDCALEIVDFYKKSEVKKTVNQIIKSYEPINQNRK